MKQNTAPHMLKRVAGWFGCFFLLICSIAVLALGISTLWNGISSMRSIANARQRYTAVQVEITAFQSAPNTLFGKLAVLEELPEGTQTHAPTSSELGTVYAYTNNHTLKIGDHLDAYYDKSNPSTCVVDFQNSRPCIVLGIVCISLSILIPLGLFLHGRKRRAQKKR